MKNDNLDLDFYGIDLNAMDISFKNMYYYVIAAETGNITQAAKRLYVTQSALSKTILSIEQKLQQPLFLRQSRTVVLTPVGEYLYRRWRPMIKSFSESLEHSKRMEENPIPKITIGCFPLLDIHRFLLPYTDQIHLRYPNTEIELLRMNYIRLLEHLNAGKADLVFTLELDMPEDMEPYCMELLGKMRMVAVIPWDNPLAEHSSIEFSQLSGERLIFSEPSGILSRQSKLEQLTNLYQFPPEQKYYVNNDLTAYLHAEQGRGIAIGPRGVYPAHNERVYRVDIRDLDYSVAALWKKDISEPQQDMIHSILESVKENNSLPFDSIF